MLGLKAKAGLLFFVSAGIFIALVVFGNVIAPKKISLIPDKKDLSRTADESDSLQNAIGEETPLSPTSPSELLGASVASIPSASGSNLTKNLAYFIGKSIVDKNPEGPTGDNLNVTGADGMADTAIAESLKNFNPAYFSPEIKQSELIIDKAQDPATYRAAVTQILKDTESLPLPSTNDPIASQMKTLAKRYENETAELRALSVPPALVTEQIKTIRIALGKQRILEAVADYENDPIYAMLALKLWDTLK